MPDSSTGTDTIITNQKGIAIVKVWAYGKTAHGSRPHLGSNAIEKVNKYLLKIRKLFPRKQKAKTKSTITIGTIKGGEQANQVPEYAEATLDIRYQNPIDFYKKFNKIKKITKNNAKIELSGSPYICDLKNTLVENYIQSQKNILQKPIKYEVESGGSDARFFSEKNIPVIVTGIEKANSHSIDENCSIEDMVNFYNILQHFIETHVDTLN
jgi:succinyl-diaminopimelate desuccinylase